MNSFSVKAHHPHWRGTLRLSPEDSSACHVESGSKGTYQVSGNTLTVNWDDYTPDIFIKNRFGLHVHEKVAPVNINALRTVEITGQVWDISQISVPVSASGDEVSMRLGTTDIQTFVQIFISNEYEHSDLPTQAETIVDLGANVGYATAFFALKYPHARILAIEPETENFALLVKNTLAFGDRVSREQAAVWYKDGSLGLDTENYDGTPMGAWGARVSDRSESLRNTVPCWTLTTLYQRYKLAKVHILKIDIEGAEKELFTYEPDGWLAKTEFVIIETHDRFQPGSEQAVRQALAQEFQELPSLGENLFFRRR
jgi:FkbM family methyltransferase